MVYSSILDRRREGNLVYYRVANDFIWKILDYDGNLERQAEF